jgi:dihydrofolate synthase/folylpolyglutamate synthase
MSAHQYLESLVQLGVKFGLETIRALCAELGRPELAFPTLLIAGTNGKGSVAAYLDHALRESGLKVGRYTSPHLVRVNERITVQGDDISDEALEEDLALVRAAAERLQVAPTYFEALTAAAFLRFRAARVDVAVLEVGMGGRLDATNVAEPLVSAIVSVDFDHEAYLGVTLDAIAREKAGVVRGGRATVIGRVPAKARRAIEEVAQAAGATVVVATDDARWVRDEAGLSLKTRTAIYPGLRPLPGAHQLDNLLVAVRVLEQAAAAGLPVDLARVGRGLFRTSWPGRLQWLPGEVPLLLDGAHNLAGVRALASFLGDVGPFVLLFGAMRDKPFAEMAHVLFPLARRVVVTEPATTRAAAAAEVAATPAGRSAGAEAVPDVGEALHHARTLARGQGPVVVAGSLYLVGAVIARLRSGDPVQ